MISPCRFESEVSFSREIEASTHRLYGLDESIHGASERPEAAFFAGIGVLFLLDKVRFALLLLLLFAAVGGRFVREHVGVVTLF